MRCARSSPAASIARRLIEKAELRSVRLADEAFAALKTFLSIRTPLDRAADELSQFCAGARLSLGPALDGLAPDEMTPRQALEALYGLKAIRAGSA